VANALGSDFSGVIFIHNEPSGVEVVARRCPKAKVCLWVQNDLFRTYTAAQAKRVARFAYRVIACSDYIAGGIRKLTGPLPHVVTLLNGVDTSVFKPRTISSPNNVPQILFVGRIVPQKGVHLLLEAAKILRSQNVGFTLRVVGSSGFNAGDALSPYEHSVRALARDLGDLVEFLPFQPRAAIVHLYQSADVLCVPSDWNEPFGLVVLEGMACGLPVVASRRGGIPEAGGDTVRYFDPPDLTGLAGQLAAALQASNARNVIGSLARMRAEQFDWSRQYERLVAVL
jgi:glycosyltransferase involved in cell wall biosynthesis